MGAAKCMKAIDDTEDQNKIKSNIDRLFAIYDKDKSGELGGDEFFALLNDLSAYIEAEVEKAEKGDQYSKEDIREWCKRYMDKNGDGKVSKQERMDGIKPLLDADESA